MNSDDTPGSNPSTGKLLKTRSYLLHLYLMCVRFFHGNSFLASSIYSPRSPTHLQSKKANFDASHELEELLLEDNPLKAKQRKPRDVNSLSTEMRQMEEQYGAFSFSPLPPSQWLFLDSRLMTLRRRSVGHIIRIIRK